MEKVIFEQRCGKGDEAIHHTSVWGKSIPGRRDSQWKGRTMLAVFKEQHEGQHGRSVMNKRVKSNRM